MSAGEFIEAEGNTIDEAIERALEELGVTRDRAAVEILSNASSGLFGIGSRKARVRVTRRPSLAEGGEDSLTAPGAVEAPVAMPPHQATAESEKPVEGQAPDVDGALARARSVLQEIVTRVGSEASVEVSADGLAIKGDPSGLLIGRRGQTLDALEYLVNRIASRSEEAPLRIAVDCESYRKRRRESLESLAQRMAERALSRRRPVTLAPMSPRDRRIVHLALQNEPQLTTRSTGEGYYRKLVIIPEGSRRPRRE